MFTFALDQPLLDLPFTCGTLHQDSTVLIMKKGFILLG